MVSWENPNIYIICSGNPQQVLFSIMQDVTGGIPQGRRYRSMLPPYRSASARHLFTRRHAQPRGCKTLPRAIGVTREPAFKIAIIAGAVGVVPLKRQIQFAEIAQSYPPLLHTPRNVGQVGECGS